MIETHSESGTVAADDRRTESSIDIEQTENNWAMLCTLIRTA